MVARKVTDDQLPRLITVLLVTLIAELAQISTPPTKTAQLALQLVVKNSTYSVHPVHTATVKLVDPLVMRILPLEKTVNHLVTLLMPCMYGIYPLVLLQHQAVLPVI